MKDLFVWQGEIGVTDIMSNTPINRLETPKIQKPLDTDNHLEEDATPLSLAKAEAKSAKTLDELRKLVENFEGLQIRKTANKTVFSDGNPNSKIMFIGEAPGANEDAQGIPFCGDSGKLLDQMVKAIGLERSKNFYITNSVFWRPPGNRRPTPEEIALCKPFVEKHIALFAPKLIVLVGATAVNSVLNSNASMQRIRQQFFDYQNEYMEAPAKLISVFHPSYLLRQPSQKRSFWEDLIIIEKFLENAGIEL